MSRTTRALSALTAFCLLAAASTLTSMPAAASGQARPASAAPNAPAALGPYSQAVRAGNTVYLSGQIPLDPKTGELVEGGFEAQVHQAFRNLKAVVEAAGAGTISVPFTAPSS